MARSGRNSVRLDQAIESYFDAIEPERLSASSVKDKRRTLSILTEAVGRVNRGTRKLTEEDFTACLTLLANGLSDEENAARRRKGHGARLGRSPRSMQSDRATLKQFVAHCKRRGWMAPGFDPLMRITQSKRVEGNKAASRVRKRRSVPVKDWPALLDAAGRHHARTRMIVAMGLLWGRRASEIDCMQWKHIHPDSTVEFFNVKRGRAVSSGRIVISPWMRDELDRWKAWVESAHGPVQPDWYLCPAKLTINDPRVLTPLDTTSYPVDPTRNMTPRHVPDDTQEALRLFGWAQEEMYGEGGHTLRRSHGILVEERGGIEAAQASLDHESSSMTQHYTGNRAGHRALNDAMAALEAPGAEPAIPVVPVQAQPPAAESNVVDFAAWRSRKVG